MRDASEAFALRYFSDFHSPLRMIIQGGLPLKEKATLDMRFGIDQIGEMLYHYLLWQIPLLILATR